MNNELVVFRRSISNIASIGGIAIVVGTIAVFTLCWLGYFSSDDVEIADHLQDVLQMIVGWLLIFSFLIFVASFFGSKKTLLLAALPSICCVFPLTWLFFINGMRRN